MCKPCKVTAGLTRPKDGAPSGLQAAHPEGTSTPAVPYYAVSEGESASALASPGGSRTSFPPGWSVSASNVPVFALTAALLPTPPATKRRGPNQGIGCCASFWASSFRSHHDEFHAEEFAAHKKQSHANNKGYLGEEQDSQPYPAFSASAAG
jgi:hypothetical protein